jgi:hypothetical protein
MFFIKRRKGRFGLHAANNACGREVLRVFDLNSTADAMAREMAAAQHPDVPTNLHPWEIPACVWHTRRMCRRALAGKSGGAWVPAVIVRALQEKGIHVRRMAEDDFTLEGEEQWLIFGERTGPVPAAVAVCGILWLDSSASAPLLLLDQTLPSSFRSFEFYVVTAARDGRGERLKRRCTSSTSARNTTGVKTRSRTKSEVK